MIYAMILHTDGTRTNIERAAPVKAMTLEEIMTLLGGHVVTAESDDIVAWCLDVEGPESGLPFNELCNQMWGFHIWGDVLITGYVAASSNDVVWPIEYNYACALMYRIPSKEAA